MAIDRIPGVGPTNADIASAVSASITPGAAEYTYIQQRTAASVALVLSAGYYVFVSDTTQSFTAYLTHADGYKTPVFFRGGQASVYLPLTSINIDLTGATNVPITIGYKSITRTAIAAPTSASIAWASQAGSNASYALNFTFTAPSGATNIMAMYRDGSVQYLGVTSTTSNITINSSALPAFGSTITLRLAACDAYGIIGVPTDEITSGARPTFTSTAVTSTTTWTVPNNTNSVEMWLVGAGGGGGGNGGNGKPGGGGGGGVVYVASQAVTPGATYTLTVGTGGTSGNNSNSVVGNTGGASSFGNLATANGGGGGGGSPNNASNYAQNGACGGGAAGWAPGSGATNSYGNGNIGFRGGAGWLNNAGGLGAGGGGGGNTSRGNDAAETSTGGNGGTGTALNNVGITVGGGGQGSGGNTTATSTYGRGGAAGSSAQGGYILYRYNS